MKLLVTTNLEETYGSEEEILFAGDWVKADLDFEQNFKGRKFKIFDSIWENNKNLKEFRSYLISLHSKLINKLSSDLNSIHKTNYSLRLWKILIDPWLIIYLEAMYTRWETINKILKKKENLNYIYLNELKNFDAPFDVNDFIYYLSASDIYNQFLFQKIINFFIKNKKNEYLKLIYSNKQIKIKENLNFAIKVKKTNYLYKFINFGLNYLSKKNKFCLEINNLGFNLWLLNLRMKQIPHRNCFASINENYNKLIETTNTSNLEIRKKISFDIDIKNDFENFLSINFQNDVPKYLIENFYKIKSLIKTISHEPKIIVSDSKHNQDTLFKFWIVNRLKNGSKLLTTDHGGSFTSLGVPIHYEEEISDLAIRWHKPVIKNNIQLPALRLINSKKRTTNKSHRKYLLTIGFDNSKYPYHIFICPSSGQALYQIKYLSSFYENLHLNLKDNFLFKPYPAKSWYWKNNYIGWNFEKRFENIFPKKKIITSPKKSLYYYNRSKVIVCTYPKTAFCEAMISGPTILLYKSNYWKSSGEFKKLLEDLKKTKILFEDPMLASEHLNQVWKNIDDWWESKNVKIVKESFINEVSLIQPNALGKWKKFLLDL